MWAGSDKNNVQLLGESVLRSAYHFLQECHRRVGFVLNLNRFKISLHLEEGTERGILTFATDLVDIQQALEGVLPYRSQLFPKEVTNIELGAMRERMNHLPADRFEAVRNMLEEGNRQRAVVRQMLEDLNYSCLLCYRQPPEANRVEFKIKYSQNGLLWPASIHAWYRNVGVGFPFPPLQQERGRPADAPAVPQARRRRLN